MRNLKKLLAVIVAICILATCAIPAFAAGSFTYETQAKSLYDMKLFAGNSASEYVPALDGSLTREQGIILLVRLFGKEAEAKALTGANAALAAYTDAAKISTWAKNYVAYAVKTGMVVGATTTTVDAQGKLAGNAFATMILRNLGYTVDAAGYATASATLQTKGGTLTAEQATAFASKELIRDDACGIMFSSLLAKDTTGKTTINNLIAAGVVTEAQAKAAGVLAITVKSATVISTKGVKVVFSNVVDTTKAKFVVKNGNVVVSVSAAWNTDKTEATLTASVPFATGNYTVTVGGLEIETGKDSASFAITSEKIDSLSIDTSAYRTTVGGTTVSLGYKILNQYGEDITSTVAVSNLVVTSSKGLITNNQPSTAGTITITGVASTETSMDVTMVDKVNAKTGKATVAINNMKSIAKITLSDAKIPTSKTKLEGGMTDVVIPYTAVDQYGNSVTFAAAGELAALTFVSSDTSVVNPTTATISTVGSNKYLTVDLGSFTGLKTVTLTAIVNATGESSQITFSVYGSAVADLPAVIAPTTRFGANDTAYQVQISVKDQFGSDIAASTIVADINNASSPYTITSGNASVFTLNSTKAALVDEKAYIQLSAVGQGTANLTITVNASGKSATLPVTVVAAKYPASMTLAPNYTYAVTGAAITLKATFNDQYGDAISTASNAVKFTVDAADFAAAPAASTVTAMADTGVQITALGWDKTSTYTAKLYAADGTTVLDTKTVALTSVKSDATLSYVMTELGTVAAYSNTDAVNYAKDVTVYAVDASGNKIALVGNELQAVVSSDAKLDAAALAAKKIKAAAIDTDGEATFTVVVNTNTGVVSIPGKVIFSKATPYATKIEALAGSDATTAATFTAGTVVDLTSNALLKFSVTDQYGQTAALSKASYVSVFVRNSTSGVTTAASLTSWTVPAAGTYKVKAITANGMQVEVTVTAQ